MRPATRHRPTLFLAASLCVPVAAGLAWAGGSESAGPAGAAAFDWAQGVSLFKAWISESYARAPALVLGLGVLAAVPPLALLGLFARGKETTGADVTQFLTRSGRKLGARKAKLEAEDRAAPLPPVAAWIEVGAFGDESRFPLVRPLVRIGRESDNDICLSDMTVHRYHAAVHRTDTGHHIITDLSSAGGNGVAVNGRAIQEARLASGDVIELGRVRLAFITGQQPASDGRSALVH